MWCTPSVFALKSFAFAAIRNNSMIISSTSLSNQCYPISSFLISFILHDFFAVNGMLPELDLTFELNQPQSGWIWFAQFITACSLPNKSTIAFHNVFVQIILKLWIKWIICIIFLSIWIICHAKVQHLTTLALQVHSFGVGPGKLVGAGVQNPEGDRQGRVPTALRVF